MKIITAIKNSVESLISQLYVQKPESTGCGWHQSHSAILYIENNLMQQ
jgi:hypothetical protein